MGVGTDELFHKFVTKTKNRVECPYKLIDGGEFLNQILYEECTELEADGFLVKQIPMFHSGYSFQLNIGDIRRAFDNVFSNLRKYTEPNIPILIKGKEQQNQICVMIENYKSKQPLITESHKIGLMTVQTLVKQNSGSVNIEQDIIKFSIEILLPVMKISDCNSDT